MYWQEIKCEAVCLIILRSCFMGELSTIIAFDSLYHGQGT